MDPDAHCPFLSEKNVSTTLAGARIAGTHESLMAASSCPPGAARLM